MSIDLCRRWMYVEIHVRQNLTIMYIDRKEMFKILINRDLNEISGLNVTLGGKYGLRWNVVKLQWLKLYSVKNFKIKETLSNDYEILEIDVFN